MCAYKALKKEEMYPDLLDAVTAKLERIDKMFKVPNKEERSEDTTVEI